MFDKLTLAASGIFSTSNDDQKVKYLIDEMNIALSTLPDVSHI